MEFIVKVILSFAFMLLVVLSVDATASEIEEEHERSIRNHRQIATTTTTQSPYVNSKCLAPRGQFPHHVYCNWFYNCWDGAIYEQECPATLAFNPKTSECDYRSNVNCGKLIFSKDQAGKRSVPDYRCKKLSGTYADPARGCAAFVICNYGIASEFTCQQGTYFNPASKVCDYPYNVECNDELVD